MQKGRGVTVNLPQTYINSSYEDRLLLVCSIRTRREAIREKSKSRCRPKLLFSHREKGLTKTELLDKIRNLEDL